MKISDGFDARRLRPKGPSNWRLRLVAGIAALLAIVGVLLAVLVAPVCSVIRQPLAN